MESALSVLYTASIDLMIVIAAAGLLFPPLAILWVTFIPISLLAVGLEKIFDFWLDKYKDQEVWETCLGLLKIRRRVSLTNIINSESIKGDSKKWALEIEELHNYKPNSIANNIKNKPMWK